MRFSSQVSGQIWMATNLPAVALEVTTESWPFTVYYQTWLGWKVPNWTNCLTCSSKYWVSRKTCCWNHKISNIIQLSQKLWFKMKSSTQWLCYFKTISGHFFGNLINISHKTEILAVILMCPTYLNLYLIKNCDIKHNFVISSFFQFCKKNNWNITTHKWPFYDHFWLFFCELHKQLSHNWGSDSHFEVHSVVV